MKIAYFVMSLEICGGVRIVLEHCNRLAARGHKMFIITINHNYTNWFQLHENVKIIAVDESPKDLDICVATFWKTCFNMQDFKIRAKKFFYFVQSDERRFVEEELAKDKIGDTYRSSSFNIITVANWMRDLLWGEFGRKSTVVPNHINPDDFYPMPNMVWKANKDNKPIVCIEGSISTTKKGVYDAMNAIKDIDCFKILVTNGNIYEPLVEMIFDKVHYSPKQIELNRIYSSVDILVKASHFECDPLVHLEGFVCKTACIITDATGSENHGIPGYNCLMTPVKDIKSLNLAIRRLIEDEELRKKLAENGRRYAEKYLLDWEKSIDILEKSYKEVFKDGKHEKNIRKK